MSLLLQLVATAGMTGLIWLVQLVHYPSFHHLDPTRFSEAMIAHQNRISFVVVPLMLGELGLASWNLWQHRSPETIAAALLIGGLWLSTMLVQVPLHQALLNDGYDAQTVQRLVSTNWVRTLLWSLNLLVILRAAVKAL